MWARWELSGAFVNKSAETAAELSFCIEITFYGMRGGEADVWKYSRGVRSFRHI